MKKPAPSFEFDEDAALSAVLDTEDAGSYLGVQCDPVHWSIIGRLDIDDYVHETEGIVAVFGSSGVVLRELGRFVVKQIDVDAAVLEGESIFDIFDLSATTIIYADLYEYGTWVFSDKVQKALGIEDEFVPSTLLIIDRLELSAEYRGRSIGLQAMKILISRFRIGAGIVAIKPFPLQFEGGAHDDPEAYNRRGFDRFTATEGTCTRRLQAHYARLGFTKIPRTPFMCLPLVLPLNW